MANVKISNLPVETVLANMTGIAGYNASGTVQISGATIDSAFAKSNSDLQFIVDNGNIIDSNAGTGNIVFKSGSNNTNTTMSVNSISSDTSFSIIGTTNNTNLTFTSGGELRFTPNASLGTPAQGDVLAAKNTLGDVEWVTPGGSTPTLQQVLDTGNTADSNGNTGTIVLTNSAQNRTATYGNENIATDYTFGIDVTGSNNAARVQTADGDVSIRAQGTGKFILLNGRVKALGSSNTLDPGSGNTSTWSLQNSNYLLDGYNNTSSTGGDIRINSRGSLTMHTGNLSTTTPGGALSIFARGNSVSLSTIDGTTGGGDVTISSSSGDVIIEGAGLGVPAQGDVLAAKNGTTGELEWITPSTPNLDISNIDANTIKADLTQSSQPQYGQAVVMEANGAIANGEPVVWDYTSGVVTARTPTSNFTQQEAIGIALENIANGATGKILISGFATVKWDGVVSPPVGTEIVLDTNSNGTSIPLSTSIIPFRSVAGGTGSYPSSAGPWTIKFDAGIGNTVKFEIVDFEFEHGTGGSPMYDRGGWVVSPDNNTYSNAQLTPGQNTSGTDGWLTSATSTVGTGVWSSSLGSSSSTSGYIFPENPTVGNVNIGDVIDLGERFAEYHFRSDGSGNFLGWDLKMFSSGLNPSALTIGQTMQADINSGTFNRLTGYQPGAPIYGYFIGGSTANNAVVCRIAPPRPVS